MKRKIVFLVMLALFITPAAGYAADNGSSGSSGSSDVQAAAMGVTKVNYTDATVTASKLNLRQGPSTKYRVVRVLTKGQAVKVLSKIGNWSAVYEPKNGTVGAVDSRYLKTSTTAAAPKTVAKAPAKATPKPAAPKKTTAKPASAPTTAIVPSDFSADEQALLDLVNKARTDAGLGALSIDKDLLKIARLKAKDMADNSYFSHQSPTYGSPFDMMRQYSISFKTAGENIAGNQTVEGAFKAWMNSDGHKKNILNSKFNFIGIGVASSNTYGKILVQQFIGR